MREFILLAAIPVLVLLSVCWTCIIGPCQKPAESRESRFLRACVTGQRALKIGVDRWAERHRCDPLWHLARGEDPLAGITPDSALDYGHCTSTHQPALRGPVAVALPREFLHHLRHDGLISHVYPEIGCIWVPDSPYVLTSFGEGVMCLDHGDARSYGRLPASRLLLNAGAAPPELLARARAYERSRPSRRPRITDYEVVIGTLGLTLALAVGAWLGVRRSEGQPTFNLFLLGLRALLRASVWTLIASVAAGVDLTIFAQAGGAMVAVSLAEAGALVLTRIARIFSAEARHLAATLDRRSSRPRALAVAEDQRCAVCSTSGGPLDWVSCPTCEAAHHTDCWQYQGGCAVYGCAEAHGRWRPN